MFTIHAVFVGMVVTQIQTLSLLPHPWDYYVAGMSTWAGVIEAGHIADAWKQSIPKKKLNEWGDTE